MFSKTLAQERVHPRGFDPARTFILPPVVAWRISRAHLVSQLRNRSQFFSMPGKASSTSNSKDAPFTSGVRQLYKVDPVRSLIVSVEE